MPIALDNETVDVCLKTDEAKPIETRPAFVCRYLTCRQVLNFEKIVSAAAGKPSQEEQNSTLNEALALAITGLKNMAGSVEDVLNDVLTPQEKWELAINIPAALSASELDKKKLLSKSPSTSANSEPSVESKTANSSAPTAPVVTALSL